MSWIVPDSTFDGAKFEFECQRAAPRVRGAIVALKTPSAVSDDKATTIQQRNPPTMTDEMHCIVSGTRQRVPRVNSQDYHIPSRAGFIAWLDRANLSIPAGTFAVQHRRGPGTLQLGQHRVKTCDDHSQSKEGYTTDIPTEEFLRMSADDSTI
jgi:hypothetical protein